MRTLLVSTIALFVVTACAATEPAFSNEEILAADPDTVIVEVANEKMTLTDAKTEECRRVEETGSMVKRKVCHNKATWAAIEKAETEAAQALRDRINGGGNSTVSTGGGIGG